MEKREKAMREWLGKPVHVQIDRPVGQLHKGMVYPINYGFIPGVTGGDGDEQDVYILGVSEALRCFDGWVIGAVLRKDDCEDKLVAAPMGRRFSPEEIAAAVRFQEQYFDSTVIVPDAREEEQ